MTAQTMVGISLEQFVADRSQRLEANDADLAPVVRDGLILYPNSGWEAEIVEAASVLWLESYEAAGGTGESAELLDAWQVQATDALARVGQVDDPPDEAQVTRITYWLSTDAANGGTTAALADQGLARTWATMRDEDVRDMHRAVEGQTRDAGQAFDVGGYQLDYPGQPVGPPEVWINCRCLAVPAPNEEGVVMATAIAKTNVPTPREVFADADTDADEIDPDAPVIDEPAGNVPWYGVLAPEGVRTGDGRMFAPESLRNRDLPIPLRYVREDVGGHDQAVVVANIQRIWREGNLVMGGGEFNAEMPEATEAIEQIAGGFQRGVSVDLDDAQVEYAVDDERPDQEIAIVTDGRISAATLVAIPAFQEAYITLGTPEQGEAEALAAGCLPCQAREQAQAAGLYVGFADEPVSDKPWSDFTQADYDIDQWKRATILTKCDDETKDCYALPIREPDGTLNRNGVHAAAARFNQVDASPEAKSAAAAALRGAYDTLDEDPPDVIAAASQVEPGETFAPGTRDGPGWLTNPQDSQRLRNYWARGEGAAKIRWGQPGDFNRCRRQLAKYIKNPQWLAGTCFSAETRFMTRDGVKSFAETVGTTQYVLTSKLGEKGTSRHGDWVPAEIKSYGTQRLMAVTLRRNRQTKTIYATPEHLWFASVEGKSAKRDVLDEYRTDQLVPGMVLASLLPLPSAHSRTVPSGFGIAAGAVFGDGAAEPTAGARIDLIGHKAELFADVFVLGSKHTPGVNPNGVPKVRVAGMPGSFKRRPSLDDGNSFLAGWLAGYIATDGAVNKRGAVTLDSADRSNLEFVRDVATRLGIATLSIRSWRRVGINQEQASDLYRLTFVGATFPSNLLLNPQHRENFDAAPHRSPNTRWTVASVAETDRVEEVFCAEVPGTESFALEDNIWVHNCANLHKVALGVWPGQEHSAEVAPASAFTIVAAVETDAVPDDVSSLAAPAEWFVDPGLDGPTSIQIEPDESTGLLRIFGHAAAWEDCHIGYGKVCKTAPHSASGYANFLLGSYLTAEGTQVPVGTITMNTGHPNLKGSLTSTMAHYDNTGTAAAYVNAGEDSHGIWVAGVLAPGMTDDDVVRLRGAKLSGDWRPIGGNLEMVAALAVNTPGFPVPHVSLAAAGGVQTALVAAGIVSGPDDHGPAQWDLASVVAQTVAMVRAMDRRAEQVAAARAVIDAERAAARSRVVSYARQILDEAAAAAKNVEA